MNMSDARKALAPALKQFRALQHLDDILAAALEAEEALAHLEKRIADARAVGEASASQASVSKAEAEKVAGSLHVIREKHASEVVRLNNELDALTTEITEKEQVLKDNLATVHAAHDRQIEGWKMTRQVVEEDLAVARANFEDFKRKVGTVQ